MKIIIAAPRSGSTFYSRYLKLTHPELICLDEYFNTIYYPTTQSEFDVTTDRINDITNNNIIKIITGKEIDFRIWDELYKKQVPVTILKRLDKERQAVSFGISYLNDIWVKFEQHSYGKSAITNSNPIKNNNINYVIGEYRRSWFDTFIFKLKQLEYLEKYLNTTEILYYEDIIHLDYTKTDYSQTIIPIKQNNVSTSTLLDYFTNKTEVVKWLKELQ